MGLLKKLKLKAPIKSYATAQLKSLGDKYLRKIKAGEYYQIDYKDGAIKISSTPDGKDSVWINDKKSQGGANVDPNNPNNADIDENNGTSDDTNQVDPSNTGTISGYDLPDQLGISSPNPHAIGYDPDHFNCFIKNLITNSIITFEMPQELADSMSSEFDQQTVRGRSLPVQGYSSSGPRTISLNLPIYADTCYEDFDTTIRKFQALSYPSYESFTQPPTCYVKIGNLINDTFVILSVNVNFMTPFRDGKYTQAEVSLELNWTPQILPSVTTIEGGTAH